MFHTEPQPPEQAAAFSFQKYRWIFFIILSSLAITISVFLITTEHKYLVAANLAAYPTLFLLNLLPVLLFMLLVFFLSARAVFSAALTADLFILLAVVNRVKVTMRQEPLLPTDLSLAKEALTIAKTFPTFQQLLLGLFFIALLAVPVLAFRFCKKEAFRPQVQALGFVLSLAAGFGANSCWYADAELYDVYPVIDNAFFAINQYNSKGLVYSFCHQYNLLHTDMPAGYSRRFFDALEAENTTTEASFRPHIIMIMGEAFSDLSDNENLDFSNYRDPLENFKAMAASENGIGGKIVVPGYGGGTSNTEYDVLTACPTRLLNQSQPSYSFIHQPFDALPSRLAQLGYETLAIHPGYAWFYNRQHVYPYLGFETCLFLEDSFDLEEQGIAGYISEQATIDKVIETLDTHIETTDTPLFSFTVTIQNHGPYESKFGPQPQRFDTDAALSDVQTDMLTQYFKGMTDADEELGRLRDYAAESSEPIVIVYFGDHLPGFSNGMAFFELLDYAIDANGTAEEQVGLYETPFLIWENDAAKAQRDFADAEIFLPENGTINAHYLGALTLELIGMEGVSALFDYANTARQILPVCTWGIYMDADGVFSGVPTSAQSEVLQRLAGWQYYKLFDEESQAVGGGLFSVLQCR